MVFVRQLPTPTLASETSVDLAVESFEKVGHGGASTANTLVWTSEPSANLAVEFLEA